MKAVLVVVLWVGIVGLVLGWGRLRGRAFDRHTTQALNVTRPTGPEDRADWPPA